MKIVNMPLVKCVTGKKLKSVKGIVIHWFADANATAQNVIKWWERQANGICAHDLIDLDGTVYHAVDYDKLCYQVGCKRGYLKEAVAKLSKYPNDCVVGIECSHIDMKGTMTDATYKSLVEHTANLLKKFKLSVDDIWLHSEIVGADYKDCHRWFTTTKPEDWVKFKKEVAALLNTPSTSTPVDSSNTQPTPIVTPTKPKTYLEKGDKGDSVKELQTLLEKLGYDVGSVDGIFGNATDTQVRKFQKDNKLSVDGLAGNGTMEILKEKVESIPAPSKPVEAAKPTQPTPVKPVIPSPVKKVIAYPGRVVQRGHKDENVKLIQQKLGINDDGVFGSNTEKAVIAFQKKNKLVDDGKVGKLTWNKLFN